MASVDIVTYASGENVAPYGVYFEALVIGDPVGGPQPPQVYNPRLHELTYVWDFDDPGDAAPRVALNMPEPWKDRNTAYGFQTAHVFRNDTGADKVCNVTVRVYHKDELIGEATETITIRDPDTAYPNTRTAIFSNEGGETWAGAPSGAVLCTSPSDINAFFSGLTQPGRLLLKRGQTIDFQIQPPGATDHPVRIGAWGSGDRPVLECQGTTHAFRVNPGAACIEYVLHDLEIRGDWDPTTESGHPKSEAIYWLFRDVSGDPFYVMDNVKIDGAANMQLGSSVSGGNPGAAATIILNDVERTNWRDYGLFMNRNVEVQNRFALVSSSIHQNVDACDGGGSINNNTGRIGFSNDHGPLRATGLAHIVVSATDMFSNNGWSSSGTGMTVTQSCMRLNTDPSTVPGFHNLVVDRFAGENGFNLVGSGGGGAGWSHVAGNFLFDKVLLVGAPQTDEFIAWVHTGATFRNLYAYHPNTENFLARAGEVLKLNGTNGNPTAGFLDEPVSLYNTTYLYDVSAANNGNKDAAMAEVTGVFTRFTAENNVFHAPNQSTPATEDVPVDIGTALSGFTPRYSGPRYTTRKVETTLGADVPDGGSWTIGYPDVGTHAGTLQLDQTDFTAPGPAGGHSVLAGSTYLFEADGDISVSFGTSTITVTNTSGTSIPGGTRIRHNFVRSEFTTDASYATLAPVPLLTPQEGSRALTPSLSSPIAFDDFLGAIRSEVGNAGALNVS